MITAETLSTLVEAEFKNDSIILDEWNKKKAQLGPHIESWPEEWVESERGVEVTKWADHNVWGSFNTYDDDLAYFCWKCGCGMGYTIDYWDGSPTYSVWLPHNEEEYQQNLKEADDYWKEVM